jgi:hypothetical protein
MSSSTESNRSAPLRVPEKIDIPRVDMRTFLSSTTTRDFFGD